MDNAVTTGGRMDPCSCKRTGMLTLACLIFLALVHPSYQQVERITIDTPSGPVSVGDQYTMTCEIRSVAEVGHAYWKQWTNDTDPPGYRAVVNYMHHTATAGWGDQVDQGNVAMAWESTATGGALFLLKFQSVQCDNGGRYECSAQVPFGDEAAVTEMDVVVKPDSPTLYINNTVVTDTEQFLADGQSATIRCSGIIGFPAGQLSWHYKQGTEPRENRPTEMTNSELVPGSCAYQASTELTFSMTKDMHDAKYWCYAYQSREGFILDSVTTRSFVHVKIPEVTPGAQASCYETGTCGASSFGISTALFLGAITLMVFHHIS